MSDYPFEDETMYYDMNRHQYILKRDFVLNELLIGEDVISMLEKGSNFEKLAISVSNDIYRYIYRHTLRSELEYKRYMLAKLPELRDILKWAMLAQVEYYTTSGGGAIKNQHGVDIERTRAIDLARLRGEGYMSPQAIDMLHEGTYILNTGKISSILHNYKDGSY